jgi:hypothetical protein
MADPLDARFRAIEGLMDGVEKSLSHLQDNVSQMHAQNTQIINLLSGKADWTFRVMLLGFTALAGLGVLEIVARFLH